MVLNLTPPITPAQVVEIVANTKAPVLPESKWFP